MSCFLYTFLTTSTNSWCFTLSRIVSWCARSHSCQVCAADVRYLRITSWPVSHICQQRYWNRSGRKHFHPKSPPHTNCASRLPPMIAIFSRLIRLAIFCCVLESAISSCMTIKVYVHEYVYVNVKLRPCVSELSNKFLVKA